MNKAVDEPKLIEWIKEKTKSAQVVMSVCNGAFLLEKAGLLNGLEITTTAGFIDSLQSLVPSAKVVRNKSGMYYLIINPDLLLITSSRPDCFLLF